MNKRDIYRVNAGQLQNIIMHRSPCGLFLAKDKRGWIAVDNSTRDAWTEEFRWKRQAVRWLHGEFEVGE